ncbi:CobW family GTP-binding protein [Methylobrevis albus]|uniref:GTP-binding protein n=1 Tax=Methylobrevis albus TaxID=2793297 RepID=A0A931HYT6_9HYPH|nr:GTP-binding protein [Methylobrevis albus]MBH0237212.1 GTP-binding protein [Methylobrevis albus]
MTEARQRREPIPVTVLTGFLGAGKTTLLNRLLADPAMRDAAVIINEFGEVGLDHLFVEADDGIVELASGCLCCTIRGDLVAALENFLRRIDNDRMDRLSRVVIETTGLADPAPVLHTIMAHPYLVLRYRLDGVVTLVDAVNGAATLDAHMEAVKQAAVADRIVLTKTDMPEGAAARASLVRRLARLNPAAPVLDAADGAATPAALLHAGLWDEATKTADVRRWLAAEAYDDHGHGHHHHDHGHGHDHDHGHAHAQGHANYLNRHDAHIRSFALTTDRAVAVGALEMFLDLLRSAHGERLLRMKGIVRLAEDPERPMVVHGVQKVFHPPVRLPAWPDADHRTRLVFITRDLEEAFVRRLFDAFAGTLAVDTPDAAAMFDNPLSLAGFSGPR